MRIVMYWEASTEYAYLFPVSEGTGDELFADELLCFRPTVGLS